MNNTFPMKTFADSYLYNAASANSTKVNNKAITDFIIKAHRLDKYDQAFSGVIEDIKRHQSSAVLISVLFNENVILCVGDVEMPLAFKVFDAKDTKNGNKPKVFVDLTGKIEFKDGYYFIRRNETDKLCALLFDALIYLLYRNQRFKLTNNANVVLAATKCYVSMFNYVLDYLRIIGFSQSKSKISYITALYFLHGMIGYGLDDEYTKNIAARIAEINPREAKAYDLYIDDPEMFTNIGTFIPAVTSIFRLKGLDLSVFVNKWIASFGTGTEFATELFTSFLVTLVNAYTGSYIIRQRQVEMACGDANLVKVANAIIRAGVDSYDVRRENADVNLDIHSEHSQELAKAVTSRDEILRNGLMIDKFNDKNYVTETANDIIRKCTSAKLKNKINEFATDSICNGIEIAYESSWSLIHGEDSDYISGTLTEATTTFKKYLDENSKYRIGKLIDKESKHLSELLKEYALPKDVHKEVASTIIELRNIKNLLWLNIFTLCQGRILRPWYYFIIHWIF